MHLDMNTKVIKLVLEIVKVVVTALLGYFAGDGTISSFVGL